MQDFLLYVPTPDFLDEATNLANFTKQVHIVTDIPSKMTNSYLCLDKDGLAIIASRFKPLYVSEIYNKLSSRRTNLKNELLIEAIKIKPHHGALIIDATAGLAKDALLLGLYGYKVLMLEKNPILATVIFYALQNSYLPRDNLELLFVDSLEYLSKYKGKTPDCIYLDPMFNDAKHSSKSKKEMQIIQELINNSPTIINNAMAESQELLKLALNLSNKVVVKRDNKQRSLVEIPQPSYDKLGKTIRYDIYLNRI